MVSLLIDGVLALDAGGLTSALTFNQQRKVKSILLTHQHFDHVKDVASLGLKNAFQPAIQLYGAEAVLKALSENLINGVLYPNFFKWPSDENPSLKFNIISPFQRFETLNYSILPLPIKHSVPALGYALSQSEKTLFYTGDTGPGLSQCWEHISPQIIITEVTGPSSMGDFLMRAGHLTPQLLKLELLEFKKIKNYFPRTVLVHMNPERQEEIKEEIEAIGRELEAPIILGCENMKLEL